MPNFAIENFLEDEGRRSVLRTATDELQRYSIPIVFFEMAANIAEVIPGDSAFRHAWHQGYVHALKDIFFFNDRYQKHSPTQLQPTFSAVEQLLKTGEVSREEADLIRKHRHGSKPTT